LNNISKNDILTKKNYIKVTNFLEKYLSLINNPELMNLNVYHLNSLKLNYFWWEELNYLIP
jgi:hypothetical protein